MASASSLQATDTAAVVAAADAQRSVAFWTLPLVLGVPDAQTAAHLGDLNAPFSAIVLRSADMGEGAHKWAQRAVHSLGAIADMAANRSVAMTPAVQIDPCATESDSLLRFSVHAALLLGAQGLWWQSMEACTEQFELVSSINRRVAQWAEPLFMRNSHRLPQGHWLAQGEAHEPDPELGTAATNKFGASVPPFGRESDRNLRTCPCGVCSLTPKHHRQRRTL